MPEKKQPKNAPAAGGDEEILDFSEVRPFDPIDSSVMYKVKVTNLDRGLDKTGTKKTSDAELTILEPKEVKAEIWEPDDDGNLKFIGLSEKMVKAEGRKLFRTFTLGPKALPFLYNFLKACDPDVELNEAFRYKPAEWIGSELCVKGNNEAYQEQVRLRPDKVYPVSAYKG